MCAKKKTADDFGFNLEKTTAIYRFRWYDEFGHDMKSGGGFGVYIPGLPLPFVRFKQATDFPAFGGFHGATNSDKERGWKVDFSSCESDGIWGVSKWIDGEPPDRPPSEDEPGYEDLCCHEISVMMTIDQLRGIGVFS